MGKRRIAVFTGNRAEYGLLYPLLKELQDHPQVDLKLLVSGAHLDKNFGNTISEIENDGFEIASEIVITLDQDDLASTARAIGSGVIAMSESLERLKPDMLVVYADRFEGFSAVIAGSQMGLPVAHIEGGDVTEGGALDDSVRHAMSKLSHLHFTTNQAASNRILAMGEEAWRVHTVGFVDHDLIRLGRISTPEHLNELYQLDYSKPIVLFTQHSVALEADQAREQFSVSKPALERIAADGAQVIVTFPNNDAGGRAIIAEIEAWQKSGLPENVQIHSSLGQPNYHGVLALAKDGVCPVVCAGNSSSGIKETPSFGCPAVNIGTRQAGRLRADNVIDTGYDTEDIYRAFFRCAFDLEFQEHCRNIESPYAHGEVGKKIAQVLMDTDLSMDLLRKRMCLHGETENGWYR